MSNKRINVTKTFLPPQAEYNSYISKIWENVHLTNQGPLLLDFESKLKSYLGVADMHFVSNGTIALQLALNALDIHGGEVITTPFSYVASTSAILWERCKPVFVDINPDDLCIDVSKIEAAITPETKAILPVHVFGNPCDVEAIELIAKKHNLKVIYDGAHAFGTKYKGKSLLDYGDISTCSFHATKLFHTIEGGCVIAQDKNVSEKLELSKRFGHNFDEHTMLGINAKASEMHAAMGLCNLKYVDEIIAKRRTATEYYDRLLVGKFERPKLRGGTEYNYAYYPLLLKNEQQLNDLMKNLSDKNIFPRRYFYPSLNKLPYIEPRQSCPISEDIASRIVCLPLYPDIEPEVIDEICEVIL